MPRSALALALLLLDRCPFLRRRKPIHERVGIGQAVPALLNVEVSQLHIRVGLGVMQPARSGRLAQALRNSKVLAKHRRPPPRNRGRTRRVASLTVVIVILPTNRVRKLS